MVRALWGVPHVRLHSSSRTWSRVWSAPG